jgi:hypothetical protein
VELPLRNAEDAANYTTTEFQLAIKHSQFIQAVVLGCATSFRICNASALLKVPHQAPCHSVGDASFEAVIGKDPGSAKLSQNKHSRSECGPPTTTAAVETDIFGNDDIWNSDLCMLPPQSVERGAAYPGRIGRKRVKS